VKTNSWTDAVFPALPSYQILVHRRYLGGVLPTTLPTKKMISG
jgi:hypothetical protein